MNESSVSAVWTKSDPGLLLAAVPDLPGYVRDGSPGISTIADPGASDTLAGMTIVIPDMFGRDLADAEILRRDDEEWLRIVSTVYRPAWTVPALSIGASVFTIGPEGYAKWRTLPTAG